jgi:signal transduction histidine kinase
MMLDRLEAAVSDEDIEQHFSERRMRGIDRASAITLGVLAVIQIAIVSSLSWYPAIAAQLHLQPHPGFWPYVAAYACFVPLAFRRHHPGLALLGTSVLAGFYLAMPWPPSIVILAPMIALFTVAERYGGRRAIPVGIVLAGIVLGVSAMTVSVSYTVAQIVAIFALLGLAAAMGHGSRTRRELFEEVKHKREEESLRRVEEERLRIARDVHDIMAHSLTLMTLQADAGLATPHDTQKSRAAFTVIGDTGRATLRDLRSMLSVLAGDASDDSPRQPVPDLGQLDELARTVRETGLDVELAVTGDFATVPSAVAVSAYRIVQEALTNVVRHAAATCATVRVDVKDDKLELLVIDDGVGGQTEPADAAHAGRGLAGMRERIDVLGGTLTAGPADGGGFEVRGAIPLTRSKKCRSA